MASIFHRFSDSNTVKYVKKVQLESSNVSAGARHAGGFSP